MTNREHRPIMLDDGPGEAAPEPDAHPLDYDYETYVGQMQRLMLGHVVPAQYLLSDTPVARILEVGHKVLLVKERRIGTVSSPWEQHQRNRDWGKIRFLDDRQQEHEWFVDQRLRGADGCMLLLPVARTDELLKHMEETARERAKLLYQTRREAQRDMDREIIRSINDALGYSGEAIAGGITRRDLEAARDLGAGSAR